MQESERMKIALHALDENLKMLESNPTSSRALDDAKDAVCIVEKLCNVMDSPSYTKHGKEPA